MTEDRSHERADVARRILELSGTIDEAIDYMLVKLDSLQEDISVYASMLKNVGEGLISLDNAASAISEPMGVEPDIIELRSMMFDEMCGQLDAMADACLADRAGDLPALGSMLRKSYTEYYGRLELSFRKSAVM